MSVGEGVAMTIRKKLLAEWVHCKQLLHQPIASGTFDIAEVRMYPMTVLASIIRYCSL